MHGCDIVPRQFYVDAPLNSTGDLVPYNIYLPAWRTFVLWIRATVWLGQRLHGNCELQGL